MPLNQLDIALVYYCSIWFVYVNNYLLFPIFNLYSCPCEEAKNMQNMKLIFFYSL